MKKLLEKLEALVDEATALVREERQRRTMQAVSFYGPKVTEFRVESPYMEPSWKRNGAGGNGIQDGLKVT